MERLDEEQSGDQDAEVDSAANQTLPVDVVDMISGNRLQELQDFFIEKEMCHGIVNKPIDKTGGRITCLELVVTCAHWEAAALLLLVLGADPKENIFDKQVQQIKVFPELGCEPNPGFQGLRMLASARLGRSKDQAMEKIEPFLSLMEWLLLPRLQNSKEDIVQAICNLRRLDPPKSKTIISAIKITVFETNAVLLKHAPKLEEVVVTDMLCHVVQCLVWDFFVDHLKDCGVRING